MRLAHNPRFANDKSPLVDGVVGAGFFLLSAFFTCVRWFGILGANVRALFRREPKPSVAPEDLQR